MIGYRHQPLKVLAHRNATVVPLDLKNTSSSGRYSMDFSFIIPGSTFPAFATCFIIYHARQGRFESWRYRSARTGNEFQEVIYLLYCSKSSIRHFESDIGYDCRLENPGVMKIVWRASGTLYVACLSNVPKDSSGTLAAIPHTSRETYATYIPSP